MGLNARSIGLKIQQARVARGMTQSELARALGIDRGSVGRWETGKSVPRQVGLPKVAKVLGLSPERLLEGSADLGAAHTAGEILRLERRALKEIRDEVRRLSASRGGSVAAGRPAKAAKKLEPREDRQAFADLVAGWNRARPEARLLAALLVTGDWSYKLKLMNREVSVGEDLLDWLKDLKPA